MSDKVKSFPWNSDEVRESCPANGSRVDPPAEAGAESNVYQRIALAATIVTGDADSGGEKKRPMQGGRLILPP